MKKLLFLLVFIPFIAFSQSTNRTEQVLEKYGAATVHTYEGYLLFINSKPVRKYEVIGNVVMNLIDGRSFKDQIYVLVAKTKDRYPNAWGLIIDTSKDRFRADVIAFNEGED